MFCKNCGKELDIGVKFCKNCGAKIEIEKNLNTNKSEEISKQQNTVDVSENTVSGVSEINANSKSRSGIISSIIVIIIVIAFLWVAITGVRWAFSTVGSWLDKKHGANEEPAIVINNISFDSYSIQYDFENISDKDVAYISFETYFYDRMGGALNTDISSNDYLKLDYTGPLYSGKTDSAYWEYLFEIPTGTAVVFPKKITVTFVDDEKITFENDVFSHTNDFYGGKLKD